ncbi:MAG: hypothetical protein LBI87_02145, partial [Candidatus Accumulibacter sp.]|nr:hypothetical protein [Accumulibacter sp.]
GIGRKIFLERRNDRREHAANPGGHGKAPFADEKTEYADRLVNLAGFPVQGKRQNMRPHLFSHFLRTVR